MAGKLQQLVGVGEPGCERTEREDDRREEQRQQYWPSVR